MKPPVPDIEPESPLSTKLGRVRERTVDGRGDASQRLSHTAGGKVQGGKPRSEPDSGNPTVRDRRGASRNVTHGGTVTPGRNRKGGHGNPSPTGARTRFLSRPFD